MCTGGMINIFFVHIFILCSVIAVKAWITIFILIKNGSEYITHYDMYIYNLMLTIFMCSYTNIHISMYITELQHV